jgi:hypothetical protein
MRRTPMTDIIHQYIDGSWTDAADGNVAELINPATGEVTGAVEQGSESDVRIWGNAAALDEYLETKAIVGGIAARETAGEAKPRPAAAL